MHAAAVILGRELPITDVAADAPAATPPRPQQASDRWSALRSLAVSALTSVIALAAVFASAQSTLYWDTNGTTAGSGAATGTWGSSTFWNTDATGGAGGAFQTSTTSLDNLFISAGTNAANATAGTITVSGTQAANSITFRSNSAVTVSSGTINLGDASTTGAGIFVTDGVAAVNTVSTPIVLGANSAIHNAGNAGLTISGGVTGAYDLTLNNNVTTRVASGGGPGTGITLSTTAINNAGKVINSGNGYGITTISAAIGSNVTEIRQSSNTSQFAISGGVTTNSGGTTIKSEGFQALSITTNAIGGTGNLVFTNNSLYSASMGSAWSGSSFIPNGIMVSSAVSTTGTITNNGAGNANVQISGVISAATGITQNSAGSNLMLFGANTYTATTTLTSGILGVGNAAALGNAAGSIVFGGGTLQHVNAVTTDFSSRFAATGGNAYKVDTNNLNVTWATGLAAAGSSGLTKFGTGTLTLAGTNAFTGDVTIGGGTGTLEPLSGGTLQVGNGTAGSLVGTNNLTFQGTGTFNLQAAAAGQNQAMGALTFAAGNGTVQSTFGTSGSASIAFSSLGARSTGGTGNFVVSGGTNGSTNSIVLTGAAAGQLLDRGMYFGGANYAAYDAGGYVRAYTSGDTNAVSSPAAATLGTVTAASNAFVTGAITAQTTASVNTININAANNVTMANGATLSVNGILKSGGTAAVISGGRGLTPIGSGDEFVVRADASGDTLTITSPLVANGTNALTKSGAGLLKLSGGYGLTGNVAINEGTLQLDNSADVTLGSVIAGAGALTKTGAGRLTLSGTAPSTYTGATVINNGTLVLDYSNMATPTNMLSPVSRITMGSPSATNGAAGIATLIIKGKPGAGVVTTQTLSQSTASKTGLLYGNNTARILVDPNGGQETRVLGGWIGNVSTANRNTGNALVIGYANDGTTNPVSASTGGVVFTTDANNNNLPSNGGRMFGLVSWAWNGGVAGTNMDFVVASPTQSNNPMNLYPVGTFGTSYGDFTSATNDNANHYRITSASGNITSAGGSVNGLKIENPGIGQTLTFTGAFSPNGGIMMTGGNDFSILGGTMSNATTNAGNGSVFVLQYSTGTLTISSVFNRTTDGGIVKLGPGRLILSGANTYKGTLPDTLLNEGILQAGAAETAGTSGPFGAETAAGTFVFGGGTLQYSAVNNFDYSGRFATSAGQPIKVDTNGRDVTFATILSSAGGTLDKYGTGTLTLSAANTYSGNTTINGGTLALTGTIASSPTIAVGSGATFDVLVRGGLTLAAGQELRGDGTALGNFTLGTGSILTPGTAGVGALKFEGSLALSPTAAFRFDLGSPATPGTTYDQIQLLSNTGFWNFDVGGINFSNFDFTALPGFGEGTYTLFSATDGVYLPTGSALGSSLTGTIDGFDASLSLGGPTGASVLLTVTSAVPEPGTLLLLAVAGLAVASRTRRGG